MIKLMSWPSITIEDPDNPGQSKQVDGDLIEIYMNPDHITVLEPQGESTLVGVLGQGVLRVGEGIEAVLRRIRHPVEWK